MVLSPGPTDEERSAFDRWYASSVLLEESGAPLLVYHGTEASFTSFSDEKSTDQAGRDMALGLGSRKHYFTDSQAMAQVAAEGAARSNPSATARVIPAFVRIQNPISKAEYEQRFEALSGGRKISQGYEGEYTREVRDTFIAQLDQLLKDEGIDGILDREITGQIAVFSSSQILTLDQAKALGYDEKEHQPPSTALYHGTTAIFSRFDLAYIGSGEGNITFGYGMYFSSNEDIARYYADTLRSRSSASYDPDITQRVLINHTPARELGVGIPATFAMLARGDQTPVNGWSSASEFAHAMAQGFKLEAQSGDPGTQHLYDTWTYIASSDISYDTGRVLYQISVPQDSSYLSWEEPTPMGLIEQLESDFPKPISPELEALLSPRPPWLVQPPSFEVTYRALCYEHRTIEDSEYEQGAKRASEYLQQLGYEGIVYPANSIAGPGDGQDGMNYVLFTPEAYQVEKRTLYQIKEISQEILSSQLKREYIAGLDEPEHLDQYDQAIALADRCDIHILSNREINQVITDPEKENAVVAALFTHADGQSFGFDIVVDPGYRRQGLGNTLAQEALGEYHSVYEEMGVELEVYVVNDQMARILERLGAHTSDLTPFSRIMTIDESGDIYRGLCNPDTPEPEFETLIERLLEYTHEEDLENALQNFTDESRDQILSRFQEICRQVGAER
jgi:GNAT superfamily N-acetyltransferase